MTYPLVLRRGVTTTGIDSISQASEDVISTMQAFGYQASDVMSIVDKYNEVGNRFAISSTGVGEALKRSAAALAAGNNSLDQSVGLIAAAMRIWLRFMETQTYRTHLIALIA